ncbi:MAG TPA: methyltransferase domain-containing protein [Chloroflexia bacterium]|nr:methyltransferase domain-containing protein [Chloroflexia bacterium]
MLKFAREQLRARTSLEQRLRILQRLHRLARPAFLGTVRRTSPLSDSWGYDRGTPVDRYYIERFLARHRSDIRGRVLEVKDSHYTEMLGRGVQRSDILDIDPSNSDATIVADLAAAHAVPSDTFDCFVLTQTLQFIYDTRAALGHIHRILRPGGVLLTTVPAVSRIDRTLKSSDYWRFTAASCQRLFAAEFGAEQVEVYSYGNVLAGVAFLTGMAYEELSRRELETPDSYFPVIVAVRAVKRV